MTKNYNKDIMNWTKFPPYDILWCDPPWEQGLVKWFQNKMKKDGHTPPDNTIEAILDQLGKLADTSKMLVIEYSEKGSELVIETMKKHGHDFYGMSEHLQTNGNPYVVMEFNGSLELTQQYKGFSLIRDYLSDKEPLTIFDPFAGIGASARAVKQVRGGHTYIGSELNPARFERLCAINV